MDHLRTFSKKKKYLDKNQRGEGPERGGIYTAWRMLHVER